MRSWLVLSVTVAAAAALGASWVSATQLGPVEDDGQAKVDVVGLRVARPLNGEKGRQALTGLRAGTTLTLRIVRPDVHVLGVDAKACRLTAFTDDQGTEMVSESLKMLRTWADGQSWVTPDGRTVLFEVLSTRTPARGARQVRFRGRIVLKCGRDAASAEQAGFRLATGSKLTAGPAAMEITGVQHTDKDTTFALATKDSAERISRLRFFGRDGGEIDTDLVDVSVVGFMGNAWHERTYRLKSPPKRPRRFDTVDVRVEYFKRIDRLAVPVNVTTGIGL